MDESNLKTGTKRQADFDVPPCVTDVVTGFFYAASLNLTVGSSQTFPVNDGGRTTDVKIDVEGRNRVKVPFGEFEALRIKAEPISGPLKNKGVLWVWFSDDARHLPLQMKSKTGFMASPRRKLSSSASRATALLRLNSSLSKTHQSPFIHAVPPQAATPARQSFHRIRVLKLVHRGQAAVFSTTCPAHAFRPAS